MMTEASTDAAAVFTQGLPFNQLVGLRIDTAREGQASGRLEIREQVHNHIGTIHAAAQFALIEALSGAATMSNLEDLLGRVTPLVEGVEVTYRKLLRGDAHGLAKVATDAPGILEAIERDGKARFVVNVSLSDADGNETTTAVARWYVRLNREGQQGS